MFVEVEGFWRYWGLNNERKKVEKVDEILERSENNSIIIKYSDFSTVLFISLLN